MRDRFDQTNKEKDMRKLVAMVEEGEEELWRNQYFQPFYFKVNEIIGIIVESRFIGTIPNHVKLCHSFIFFVFQNDPGGILYQREPLMEDRALDLWHPWEKVRLNIITSYIHNQLILYCKPVP